MTAVGDLVVRDLDEFAERLENPTPEQAEAIASALAGGELEAWLEVRWDPPEQVPQMVERLRTLQQRVGKRTRLACYALRNLLDPDEPLPLLPGVALIRPEDIAAVLDEAPQERRLRLEALQDRIEGGYVEEWLRAREAPQAERTLALLQDSARRYPREPLLQAHVFRWIYAPGSGVPFMGQEVNDPRQLATLIDSSNASRQGGQEILRSGWLRQWLLASGRLKDPRPLDRVLDDERLPQEGKLESVLHLLDTSLAWPKAVCEPKELDFGKVRVGEAVERTLRVRKSGRGYLWGGLLVNGASGVIVDRDDFQGEDTEITVSARPNALMAGSRQEGTITVTTADNVTTAVPWRYKAVSAEQSTRKWVFIGIVVSFVAVLAMLLGPVDLRIGQKKIMLPFEDRDVCLTEYCQYGRDLVVAQRESLVYEDRKADSRVVFKVMPHEKVTVLSGLIVTNKAGKVKIFKPVPVGGAIAPVGSILTVLTSLGEGCFKIWFQNDIWSIPPKDAVLCDEGDRENKEWIEAPEQEFWVQLRNKHDHIGWTKQLSNFSPNDDLLIRQLLSNTSSLSKKLASIDEMIRNGADINGPGSKHGFSPAVAAVQTGDAKLVRELLKRGLVLANTNFCPADFAFEKFLMSDEGRNYIDMLLQNGLTTDCVLRQRSVYSFVLFGSARSDYDVEAAIRAVDFLTERGLDINAKPLNGKTVLEEIRASPVDRQRKLARLVESLQNHGAR